MSAPATKSILFVDDDPVILLAYRPRLTQAGFQVATAQDGLEAMRQLTTLAAPDLIVLDLMLPKLNGTDLLKFIRSHEKLKNIPVIMLSTNSIIDNRTEEILTLADRRLLKETCTPAGIIQAANEILGIAPAK
jgi:CheY-like chemotaxis protein